jgi:hypothetical protein
MGVVELLLEVKNSKHISQYASSNSQQKTPEGETTSQKFKNETATQKQNQTTLSCPAHGRMW